MTPERNERLNTVLFKRQPGITVVLENVSDPHNISAVMRTCDAIGAQDIYVINSVEAQHKAWSAKSSSSASRWLSVHQFTEAKACFKVLREKYKKIYTTHLSSNAVDLYELDLTESVALIFGNEHSGISPELIGLADGNFIIPQVGIIKSLNVSVACAVALYEAYRQKTIAGHYNQQQLSGKYLEDLRTHWGLINNPQ